MLPSCFRRNLQIDVIIHRWDIGFSQKTQVLVLLLLSQLLSKHFLSEGWTTCLCNVSNWVLTMALSLMEIIWEILRFLWAQYLMLDTLRASIVLLQFFCLLLNARQSFNLDLSFLTRANLERLLSDPLKTASLLNKLFWEIFYVKRVTVQIKQLEFICSNVERFIWLFFHLLFLDLENCCVVIHFAKFELVLQSLDLKVVLGLAS